MTCAGGTACWRRWTSRGQGTETPARTWPAEGSWLSPRLSNSALAPLSDAEHHDRVFQRAHGLELVQHPANLAVHPVDHRRVNRHLVAWNRFWSSLNPSQATARATSLVLICSRNSSSGVPVGQLTWIAVAKAQFTRPISTGGGGVARGSCPSPRVTVAIARDVVGRGLQREVRRGEGQIQRRTAGRMIRRVVLQAADR